MRLRRCGWRLQEVAKGVWVSDDGCGRVEVGVGGAAGRVEVGVGRWCGGVVEGGGVLQRM